MQHSSSSEPDISSANQGYPGTSWNQKIHYRVQNWQPIVSILSQVNHSQNLWYSLLKISFNIILPSAPRSLKWVPSFRFSNQNAICTVSLLSSYVPSAFPLSSSCTSSVLDQNIFLINSFSNTFNLCSSGNIGGQVSHQYATSSVIIVLLSKGHSNNMLFADTNKTWCTKINHFKL